MPEARRHCVFLTEDGRENGAGKGVEPDDEHAAHALRRRGWSVHGLGWRQAATASDLEGVLAVVRSTWDYVGSPADFLASLAELESRGARLANRLETMRWNCDKSYLRDLERAGVPVVPTRWWDGCDPQRLAASVDEVLQTSQGVVLKPTIGANAYKTLSLRRSDLDAGGLEAATRDLAGLSVMVQPLLDSVRREGEWSVVFLGGAPSHAVIKRPAAGEFRVQESLGGRIAAAELSGELIEAAAGALAPLEAPPLYARVDLLRGDDGGLLLIELELIEPSLFFALGPGSAERFADAVEEWTR
ncbi:MAG: hypothetical protein DWQ36_13325 [Acidobacteria bacterium]|nr:MAG: hypothetical protein DWQ30_05635 [Acidobacteriota bacterium]REK06890.1 MAG: hypothetical protein DWQ36_13325 [Acidobacteriota bacterium]